jgi:plastocyanin
MRRTAAPPAGPTTGEAAVCRGTRRSRRPRPRAVPALLAMAATAALPACTISTLAPIPTTITLSASRTTAAVGETIAFIVEAEATSMVSVSIEYGDGESRSQPAQGARTARVTFSHAYSAPGSYTVRARVDTDSGAAVATPVTVLITAAVASAAPAQHGTATRS